MTTDPFRTPRDRRPADPSPDKVSGRFAGILAGVTLVIGLFVGARFFPVVLDHHEAQMLQARLCRIAGERPWAKLRDVLKEEELGTPAEPLIRADPPNLKPVYAVPPRLAQPEGQR